MVENRHHFIKDSVEKGHISRRIPLDFLEGEKFRNAADNYIRPLLTKADILEQLVVELENSGRILKNAGDLVAAAALADEARSMDLADRYLNSECVLRMLEADQVGLADKTAVLFTKDGDQHNNLHDMQCMWYELASGESYFRQGDLGRALKKFLAVEKHYADMTEDQFDFHSYCLRKMTLRAYVSMLKFQDQLHSHIYFHKAAAGAIRLESGVHGKGLGGAVWMRDLGGVHGYSGSVGEAGEVLCRSKGGIPAHSIDKELPATVRLSSPSFVAYYRLKLADLSDRADSN
ncbi:hypothetical protein KSP40_PGU009307 [Platanthera guangdongensis]|uniref:Uncharacterized protein n=1 Tax=Platanthera guangdongensis TaxID=2320717 RepID=A0ABR2LH43_9ASPA